ncbi:hypothetical protein EYZ11_004847 [Aspergillus tanneri]|uniref:Uncharacterized protein n=1 Tax=Aspergillus tanneri TaxID=1220188 RepID=A0A4S3JK22_9EURO|nr:hypothetical protein EYZ11_004847 [Aspergillus tanneri]
MVNLESVGSSPGPITVIRPILVAFSRIWLVAGTRDADTEGVLTARIADYSLRATGHGPPGIERRITILVEPGSFEVTQTHISE